MNWQNPQRTATNIEFKALAQSKSQPFATKAAEHRALPTARRGCIVHECGVQADSEKPGGNEETAVEGATEPRNDALMISLLICANSKIC